MGSNSNKAKTPDPALCFPLPSQIDAEDSLLCAILLDNSILPEIAGILSHDKFYKIAHQNIFKAMVELNRESLPIDTVTLKNALQKRGKLKSVGGAAYIAGLLEVPMALNPKYYSEMIIGAYNGRELLRINTELSEAILRQQPPEKIESLINEMKTFSTPDISGLPAFDPEEFRVCNYLTEEPPPTEFLTYIGNTGFLPKGIVGGIVAAGGTGKSRLLMQFAMMLAGGKSFYPFRNEKPIKVLCLFAEDDQKEVNRRLWAISPGQYPKELFAKSMYGQIDPLMKLDMNNPVTTPQYDWIETAIRSLGDLDVLIIDPFSRFYGLEENNNTHATAWVKALEKLSVKYGTTILFTHHVNKESMNSTARMSQVMARGASGVVDAVRWCVGMRPAIENDIKKYDLKGNVIEFDLIKTNNTLKMATSIFFEINQCGVVEHVSPETNRIGLMASDLADILIAFEGEDTHFTRRELSKEKAGKPVADALKERFSDFKRLEIQNAIDEALKRGYIEERRRTYGKGQVRIEYIPIAGISELKPESRKAG